MTRLRLLLPLLAIGFSACNSDRQPSRDSTAAARLEVHVTQRNAFQTVAGDTLSDSARVLDIHPEQDGDALVVLFADPARRVSSGLAIVDRKMTAAQLLWPDSVTSAWWSGPHMLAFTTTTGNGIRMVVDVHAAAIRVADTSSTGLAQPVAAVAIDSGMMQRARAYTDSVQGQIGGAPQGSALTYAVTKLIPSRDGRMAAFHTAARDVRGTLTNPAWYVLDRESGTITRIDQVTGPVNELPERAGQWSEGGSFFYAKGRALWEAEITRSTPAAG